MNNVKNIGSILQGKLCCGCGACVGVCPVCALSVDLTKSHIPVLDEGRCTLCGLCYLVCPGKGYPVRAMVEEQQVIDHAELHPKYGPIACFYRAQAVDHKIMSAGASGGAATAVLLYLLETGAVECVVVPVLNNGIVEPVITDNPEIVRAAQGSKYVPVPMARVIADFKKNPKKFAMTCTPCQLAAWKMAEQKIPILQGYLVLSVGLFCGYVQNYESIHCLARNMGINYPDEAEFLGWRCGRYPGNTRFRLTSNELVDKPYYASTYISIPYFSLNRCFLCPDGANWLADIVLGDIHSAGKDETVVVCRSRIGLEILTKAATAKRIRLIEEGEQFAQNTSIDALNIAKMLPALAVIENTNTRAVPMFDLSDMFAEYPIFRVFKKYWIIRYRLLCWAQQPRVRHRLEQCPRIFEWLGNLLYGFPRTIPGWRYIEFLERRIYIIFKDKIWQK